MKKNALYRFLVLLAVFLFTGAVLILSLSAIKDVPPALLWGVGGGYLGLFVIVEVANEIVIHKKNEQK
jgi:hypothetical protein